MAPNASRESAAAALESSDIKIAELAVRNMNPRTNDKATAKADMLHKLSIHRLSRASLGLDRWMEDVPQGVQDSQASTRKPIAGRRHRSPRQQAWAALAPLTPGFTKKLRLRLGRELVARLAAEKKRREAQNLNHWDEYAPVCIARLADQLIEERNAKIGRFLSSHKTDIPETAWRITRDWELAEKAITQTYMELWTGRTSEAFFFRALKMNARNEIHLRGLERDKIESLDTGCASRSSSRAELLRDLEVEPDQEDFISHRPDDQDPLEILVQREERAETDRLVAQAFSDPRWRYIKHRDWAAFSDENVRNRPFHWNRKCQGTSAPTAARTTYRRSRAHRTPRQFAGRLVASQSNSGSRSDPHLPGNIVKFVRRRAI